MSKDNNPQVQNDQSEDHKDFDKRLQHARNLSAELNPSGKTTKPEDGKGTAMRIGTELVSAVAVGGGIGFLIDTWLGTKPWFLIGFLLLGNAAGVWNVFRMAKGQSYKVGFDSDKQSKTDETK